MTKSKTFFNAIRSINSNTRYSKKFLTDKRLTRLEKNILQSYLYLRDGLYAEIILLLSREAAEDAYVEAQRNLVLGIAYNDSCELRLASQYLEEAWDWIKDTSYTRTQFFVLYNLFTVNLNLKHPSRVSEIIKQMEQIDFDNDIEILVRFKKCQFNYYTFTGEFEGAEKILEELENNYELDENQSLSLLIDKFDFLIKQELFQECYDCLEEMKKYRVFHRSSYYKFMKYLLDHVTKNKALYVYDKDFAEFPILFYQIKVIASLEAAEEAEASTFWKKLQHYSPDVYKNHFHYHGDKGLFSLALEKHLLERQQKCPVTNEIYEKNKELTLLKLLQEAQTPLSKNEIYKIIWGEEVQAKSDLGKLSRLISRLKSKYKLSIKIRKGRYFIESGGPQKKVA